MEMIRVVDVCVFGGEVESEEQQSHTLVIILVTVIESVFVAYVHAAALGVALM